jgi:hypothetical protein
MALNSLGIKILMGHFIPQISIKNYPNLFHLKAGYLKMSFLQ